MYNLEAFHLFRIASTCDVLTTEKFYSLMLNISILIKCDRIVYHVEYIIFDERA